MSAFLQKVCAGHKMTPQNDRMGSALVGRRILVAEQEEAAAKRLSGMLKSSGCAVVGPAATSAISLSLLRSEAIDGAIVGFDLATAMPTH